MSGLPSGEYLVCIVAAETKATKGGDGGYLALTLEALSGPHDQLTHIDRLNIRNVKPHVQRIANERFAAYLAAVGIEPQSGVEELLFKPFIVEIGPQKKTPANLEVKGVKPVRDDLKADAREAAWARRRDRDARKAVAPEPSAYLAPQAETNPADELVIQRVSDVPAERLAWLWPQRFALGKVSILAGDPGLGKSQLTAFLAAKVTTGGEWPNSEGIAPQGDVVMLSCEDDLADTIRPRLEAAGADISRVHVVTAVSTGAGKRRSFNLANDIAKLEWAIEALGGRARLVVIDPITAYMGSKIDNNGATEVRDALNPVQDLAARYGVAIICVSHPPKNAGQGKAVNAVIGSQAYVAATRASWIVTRDPDNEDRRLLLQAKNNLGNAKGLAFTVQTENLPTGVAPYIAFEQGYVSISADEALGSVVPQGLGRNQMDRAKTFLHRELAKGPVDHSELMQRAEHEGITLRTLQRAATAIGVSKRKKGFDGGWEWGFPFSHQQLNDMFAPFGLPPMSQ